MISSVQTGTNPADSNRRRNGEVSPAEDLINGAAMAAAACNLNSAEPASAISSKRFSAVAPAARHLAVSADVKEARRPEQKSKPTFSSRMRKRWIGRHQQDHCAAPDPTKLK